MRGSQLGEGDELEQLEDLEVDGCWSGFAGGLGHCFLPRADWLAAGILLSPKPQRQIQVRLSSDQQSSHQFSFAVHSSILLSR